MQSHNLVVGDQAFLFHAFNLDYAALEFFAHVTLARGDGVQVGPLLALDALEAQKLAPVVEHLLFPCFFVGCNLDVLASRGSYIKACMSLENKQLGNTSHPEFLN